ncbi:MAG: hypothetical protein EPO35_11705 [Acidobacteria bacterium]|nr:MAG: hypothetical protein EPO35_11705 [Acidobacteriota bacterium]
MNRLRQGLGPLIIALAAWCAAGTLAVASADSATARIAAPAPFWIALGAFAVAIAVRPWRDSPWTAAPALLAVLPWLPVPMSPVFLIWTGPMAWAPILLSLALAIGLAPIRRVFTLFNLFEPDDATVAALVLAGLLGGGSAWAANGLSPGGDEPHYLIITQSLLKDGDLDIENNHARRDYASYFGGNLRPDLLVRGVHGEAYSVHAPGVPVLVAPLFQFFGYTGARLMIILLTSIGAMLIWRLSWRATDSPEAAWFAWAAVVLTPTFVMQSFSVFPDGPGLLPTAAGVLLLVQLSRGDIPGVLPTTLTGVALAALPWMHTRFALIAGALGAVVALRMVTMDAPAKVRAGRLIALLIVPIASALAWFYYFSVLYGSFDPRAQYGPQQQELAWIGPAILGLFFDGQFGLAAYAPAVAVVFVGLVMRPEKASRRLLLEIGVVVLLYLAAVTTVRMWWAGRPAAPARFMMALLPLLAVPLAVAWSRVKETTRTLFAGLAGFGAATTVLVLLVDGASLALKNDRTAQPLWLEWLSPVADLSRVWPSFFWQEPRFPLHVLLVVGMAVGLWLVIKQRGLKPRVAASLWAIAAVTILAPIGWAYTGAAPLDPAPSQLGVIRAVGAGASSWSIGPGRFARQNIKGALAIDPQQASVIEPPPLMRLSDVPAGRYVARVRSTSAFPTDVRLSIGRSSGPWRVFAIPGAGEFSFPFLVPASVGSLVVDSDPAARAALSVQLGVDGAVKDPGLPIRAASQYAAAGVLFLDDNAYPEKEGFWVRGRQDAQFVVVPDPSAPATVVRLLVRNGAAPNQVSVESGTFQRLLVMTPGQEQDIEVPLGAGGSAAVRVASGDGFVPAEKDPNSTDRRTLGVWISIR